MLKLIIATRGWIPKTRADAALEMAMAARSPASGWGLGVDGVIVVEHHLVMVF